MTTSFLWYDYETFGSQPQKDRPAQFAAQRTDESFRSNGAPIMLYCHPPLDRLPSPEACLITGITPQEAQNKGIPEAQFAKRLFRLFNEPGTCSIGYNSHSFDNPLTRFLFWRNFLPPYEHEYKNGTSRFDLINVSRGAAALRPSDIHWPINAQGKPSFRLEDLTRENGIGHEHAHDARSDVEATIQWAKRIHAAQPKLFSYALSLRFKDAVKTFNAISDRTPFLYSNAFFDARVFATSAAVVVASHPTNKNACIVYDLRKDPRFLLESSADVLRDRLFARKEEDSPPAQERPGLSELRFNASPFIAPIEYLKDPQIAKRLELPPQNINRHFELLRNASGLEEKVQSIYQSSEKEVKPPQEDLYGGFLSWDDQAICRRIQSVEPAELADLEEQFDDARLGPMLFLYRAQNFPETLSGQDKERWREHRRCSIRDDVDSKGSPLEHYFETIAKHEEKHTTDPKKRSLLEELRQWGTNLNENLDARTA